jgi:hypothetical protein
MCNIFYIAYHFQQNAEAPSCLNFFFDGGGGAIRHLCIAVTVIYENGEDWNVQLTLLFFFFLSFYSFFPPCFWCCTIIENVPIVLDEHTAIILRVEMVTDERLVLLEMVSTGQTMWTTELILLRLEKQGE